MIPEDPHLIHGFDAVLAAGFRCVRLAPADHLAVPGRQYELERSVLRIFSRLALIVRRIVAHRIDILRCPSALSAKLTGKIIS